MEWNNITDKMPGESGNFLTHFKGNYSISLYDKIQRAFYTHGGYSITVEHWAEIVAPDAT